MTDERKLKLFVAGQASGNPDDWDGGQATKLIFAYDENEAKRLADGYPSLIHEVDSSVARVVYYDPCYSSTV